LVAIVSFVCSVGNLPLAAALWSGGISFGGVVSFIFADLITLPLLLIYRRQYGRAVMLRMLGVSWVVMALAGLATEALFSILAIVPRSRPRVIVSGSIVGLNITTALDVVAIITFGGVYYLARHRDRWSQNDRYAIDVVCGMQVEKETAPSTAEFEDVLYFFCSEHCQIRFDRDPSRFGLSSRSAIVTGMAPDLQDGESEDPVCHMTVTVSEDALSAVVGGETYYFCGEGCRRSFMLEH
jgi:YHS domain-containing protein